MKKIVLKIILFFVYKAVKVLNGRDSVITKEIKNLPNNYTIKISTTLSGLANICFQVQNEKIKRVKNSKNPDLHIMFKNNNLAYQTLTGKVSMSQAYAQHFFVLFGNINIAMSITRIFERVEGYLLPKSNVKLNKEISTFKTYLLCIF